MEDEKELMSSCDSSISSRSSSPTLSDPHDKKTTKFENIDETTDTNYTENIKNNYNSNFQGMGYYPDTEKGSSSQNKTNGRRSSNKTSITRCYFWSGILIIVLLLLLTTILAIMLTIMMKLPNLNANNIQQDALTIKESEVILDYNIMDKIQDNRVKPVLKSSPKTARVHLSQSIVLDCTFDRDVECYWLRGSEPVNIDDGYEYVNELQKNDCSMKIVSVQEIDYRDWQCGCTDTDTIIGTVSSEATLTKSIDNNELSVVKPLKDQIVQIGDNIVLECGFSDLTTCLWKRNGDLVSIGERYSYVTEAENGDTRKDCSIKIENIKPIDLNTWSCESTVDGIFTSMHLTQTQEKPDEDPHFKEQPENVSEKMGTTIDLKCIFKNDVICAWLRNGQHVEIKGRYNYMNPDNKEDCSITISNLKQNDMGTWSCTSMGSSDDEGVKSRDATVSII